MLRTFLTIVCLCHVAVALLKGPISGDFQNWLSSNGYNASQFARTDIAHFYGSFGGRAQSSDPISKQPVIFVHGVTDQALQHPDGPPHGSGWAASINYFMQQQSYSQAEVYATTWGAAKPSIELQTKHTCAFVMQVRKFIEAVIAYTGADKVDVITHSMGTTLARRAIKGGHFDDRHGQSCALGDALTAHVDTFLGLAGVNYGMCKCVVPVFPICNAKSGFFPGFCGFNVNCGHPGHCSQKGYSTFLEHLNKDATREADNIFAFWTRGDKTIGHEDLVWGKPSSRIPGMNQAMEYSHLGHVQLKDQTAAAQYNAVAMHHVCPHNEAICHNEQ